MKLSEHLHHPSRPELIVTADSIQARVYLLGGDSVEEVDAITVPRERKSDNEGSFASSDGTHVGGGDSDVNDGPRLHDFLTQLSSKLITLTREHKIQGIRFVMPKAVEHPLRDLLPSDVETLIETSLDLNLMKSPLPEVLERIYA